MEKDSRGQDQGGREGQLSELQKHAMKKVTPKKYKLLIPEALETAILTFTALASRLKRYTRKTDIIADKMKRHMI